MSLPSILFLFFTTNSRRSYGHYSPDFLFRGSLGPDQQQSVALGGIHKMNHAHPHTNIKNNLHVRTSLLSTIIELCFFFIQKIRIGIASPWVAARTWFFMQRWILRDSTPNIWRIALAGKHFWKPDALTRCAARRRRKMTSKRNCFCQVCSNTTHVNFFLFAKRRRIYGISKNK